jgi:hypothetical protein
MNTMQKDIPLLLTEKCGADFEIEKIIGYQYSIGYITEDWDFPIENYYCEKEECWSGGTHEKTEEWNELKELEDLSKWDKELIGRFSSKHRGYYEDFYKADNGQWPSLCWAYLYVYIVSGNSLKTIKFQEKDREAVVYGAFEELRSWLEERFKKETTFLRGQKNKTKIWIGTTIVLVYAVNSKSITTRKKSGLSTEIAGVNMFLAETLV